MAGWSGLRESLQLHRRRAPSPAAVQGRWTTISPDPRPPQDRWPSAVVIHARRAREGLPANPPPAA